MVATNSCPSASQAASGFWINGAMNRKARASRKRLAEEASIPPLCPDLPKPKGRPAKRFPIPAFAAKFCRVAHLDVSSRVGRSQGASIFWGVISVCFAAAACFYFWKNHENETKANVMRDQVLQLTEENETL